MAEATAMPPHPDADLPHCIVGSDCAARPQHWQKMRDEPLLLDGFTEGIAVRVLTYESGVDDVRGLCRKSGHAARRANRCSPDVGVIAFTHAHHHLSQGVPSRDRLVMFCAPRRHWSAA